MRVGCLAQRHCRSRLGYTGCTLARSRPLARPAPRPPAQVFCTECCGAVVDQAAQLCGANSLRVGHPLERLIRTVREWRFAEGGSDVLRVKLAKAALKRAQSQLEQEGGGAARL